MFLLSKQSSNLGNFKLKAGKNFSMSAKQTSANVTQLHH
jgi:hypothetical protein